MKACLPSFVIVAVVLFPVCTGASEVSPRAPMTLAQGGSVGGIIGKRGKSVAGEEAVPSPERSKRARQPSKRAQPPEAQGRRSAGPCGNVTGTWAWYNNVEVVIRVDGTTSASNGDRGRWTCANGQLLIRWRIGRNRLTLSPDGKRLTGTNLLGAAISNARK